MHHPNPYPSTLLRRAQVEAITSLSRAAILAKGQEGSFPSPIRITGKLLAWKLDEIEAWVNGQKEWVYTRPAEMTTPKPPKEKRELDLIRRELANKGYRLYVPRGVRRRTDGISIYTQDGRLHRTGIESVKSVKPMLAGGEL